jgi:RHH-type transcriptional regulator, proline utilization regulon repressor / proline dehydrogenase / delta 1-pyrroline-5-carboxylate dehydrogenase
MFRHPIHGYCSETLALMHPFAALDRAAIDDDYALTEQATIDRAVKIAALDTTTRANITALAKQLAETARQQASADPFMLRLLNQFGLDTPLGIALMQMVEALPRTAGIRTAIDLLDDKLGDINWQLALNRCHSNEARYTVRLLRWLHHLSNATAKYPRVAQLLIALFNSAANRMGILFIAGESIDQALRTLRHDAQLGYRFSFDMLGEAALTHSQSERFFASYLQAIDTLKERQATIGNALSVKLSALHPRFEERQRSRAFGVLSQRLCTIACQARAAGLALTIDAEESERLNFTMDLIEYLCHVPQLQSWSGLGIAVQAYQRGALSLIDWLNALASRTHRRLNIRLVKGAYWDSEIKRAQQLGLSDYPVFTNKAHTDIHYLACARSLLSKRNLQPQFATHNAHTIAAIVEMAKQAASSSLEFQRLHGMGGQLHLQLLQRGFVSQIYVPIGNRQQLLPYLVRRLLENGASASFVHQLPNPNVSLDELVRDPFEQRQLTLAQAMHSPRRHTGLNWDAALGLDIQRRSDIAVIQNAVRNQDSFTQNLERTSYSTSDDIARAMMIARDAVSHWSATSTQHRAALLERCALLLEQRLPQFVQLAVREAGKTYDDAIAEVREAIEFCCYYADQVKSAEHSQRQALGVAVCISPWNFPLAIFCGQVVAALAVGNCVIAKPAEQTPQMAITAVKLMHEAGIPKEALQLILGDGAIGALLVADKRVDVVCFTGSLTAARSIAKSLAPRDVPLIAETGGINAMIVDSSALPEQVARDAIYSAFQSAGQRCSALRVLCLPYETADEIIGLLRGYLATMQVGDPADPATDVGPVIDAHAHSDIRSYIDQHQSQVIAQAPLDASIAQAGYFIAPTVLIVDRITDVTCEIFGPVLHVLRYQDSEFDNLISQINAQGYGLTLSIHSRSRQRALRCAALAKVGNVYINRHQVGAAVAQQPFGGSRLSGTGPKAGGPMYLLRLSKSAASKTNVTLSTELKLPSIVGEENSWRLQPRGNLLCLGGKDKATLVRQIELALATANSALVITHDVQQLQQRYPAPAVTCIEPPAIIDRDWLSTLEIDGVMVDDPQLRTIVTMQLAELEGPLLAVLSVDDEPYRFYLEQVVTINTAAAGGDPNVWNRAGALRK